MRRFEIKKNLVEDNIFKEFRSIIYFNVSNIGRELNKLIEIWIKKKNN